VTDTRTGARVEFCGEVFEVAPDSTFTIGREGNLVIDDNPFLHRRFLAVSRAEGLWWLANVGTQLSVSLAEPNGQLNAWLAPGARIPLVFPEVSAWFTAGPTTYELIITVFEPPYSAAYRGAEAYEEGTTTLSPVSLTPEQLRVVLALSEPTLMRSGNAASEIPSSTQAARRLNWTLTKFNRKLDSVCEKFDKQGVRGLRGSSDQLASNRRARLVEYALSTRLVKRSDLSLLEASQPPESRRQAGNLGTSPH
jgi:hypothetical protein